MSYPLSQWVGSFNFIDIIKSFCILFDFLEERVFWKFKIVLLLLGHRALVEIPFCILELSCAVSPLEPE